MKHPTRHCFSGADSNDLECFMQGLIRRNPGEEEFHQAVREVAEDIVPFVAENPRYQEAMLLERMTEPDQAISWRVCWTDDDGNARVNRAWRVQFNSTIGPYKGGLRLEPGLTESVLKFLGFEQCFKNALTGLPIGGAKGGANFDPKGKSDGEIMRFCQALMTGMYQYIGEHRDIPAGDIGTGNREIGYLFGQYRRLTHRFVGALTGKGVSFGGSELRTEATGYGVVYFVQHMLDRHGGHIEGKRIAISGAGNVARYAAEKAVEVGAKVVTLSDSGGLLYRKQGFSREHVARLHRLKEEERGSLESVAEELNATYYAGRNPWHVECDIALPCALQNELDEDDARRLIENGCRLVAEGANMPCTSKAVERLQADQHVLYGPGKAANAGGVAVSGLERSQNAQFLVWSKEEVDRRLVEIMETIHNRCVQHGGENKTIDYRRGANIGGFVKLGDAMLAQGLI